MTDDILPPIPEPLVPFSTLREARAFVSSRAEAGTNCPCCGRTAKLYRRRITPAMAGLLVWLHGLEGPPWGMARMAWTAPLDQALIENPKARGDYSKLALWGLVETGRFVEGGPTSIRLTPLGLSFAQGRARVPEFALVYDGDLRGLAGPEVSIHQALGAVELDGTGGARGLNPGGRSDAPPPGVDPDGQFVLL